MDRILKKKFPRLFYYIIMKKVKTRKTKTVDSKTEYIPTLRFINKSLFGEVGVNLDGDPSFHLMYTF